jgi:hypothetical protein
MTAGKELEKLRTPADDDPTPPPGGLRIKLMSSRDDNEEDDLTAVLQGPRDRWTMRIRLARRWRWYVGVTGLLIVLLSSRVWHVLPVLGQLLSRGRSIAP